MAPKPSPAKVRFRIDGPFPAAAEILASDRLSDFSGTLIDPNSSKGNFLGRHHHGPAGQERADQGRHDLQRHRRSHRICRRQAGDEPEARSQHAEGRRQQSGFQVRGDVKINGQQAALDYRKPAEGDADVKLPATLDDASRARLGLDLGPAVIGAIPIKLIGKIGSGDHDSRLGIEADLTSLKLDNILPGWVKVPGKSGKATFNVVQKPQSTRFEDIVVEGGGVSIKGSLEVDQNGDLLNANFPTYSPTEGDKTSLRAERGSDGVVKVTMRGDVFDGRGFLKSAISGQEADAKSKTKNIDFDVDLKLGAVAGFNGEALRSVDCKILAPQRRHPELLAHRQDRTRHAGDRRSARPRAGAARGDRIWRPTMPAPSSASPTPTPRWSAASLRSPWSRRRSSRSAKEGLINVRDFTIKGEASLDRVAAGGPRGTPERRLRSRGCVRNSPGRAGSSPIREGVVKGPTIGATIEGNIDYLGNQVRMSGTFVPMYGLNNMFGQIPIARPVPRRRQQ